MGIALHRSFWCILRFFHLEQKMVANGDDLQSRFKIVDYVIFGCMLAISAAVGFYYGCRGSRQKTAKEFLVANHSMGPIPVSVSLMASFIAAPGVLGIPAEVYAHGTSYILICISIVLAVPICVYFYLPKFYDMDVTSSYEYLERRFNKTLRRFVSFIFIINMVAFLAIVTYVPALALSQVTGINVWTSIAAMGVVCTLYTTIGGIKTVIITDLLQVIIMLIAITVVLIKGIIMTGGIERVWHIASEGNRTNPFKFDFSFTERHTFWELSIGAIFLWLSIYGVNQVQVQRYLASPTKRKAQIALWLNIPGQILFITLSIVTGLVLYAYYWNCDPLKDARVQSSMQLLPLFVMEIGTDLPGLPGVFVAGLFSSSLSTLSSGLNSLAAVTLEDFIMPYLSSGHPKLEERAGFVSKILALSYGILSIALIIGVAKLENIFQAVLTLFSTIGASVLGVFTLGLVFPFANSLGAILGFCCSIVIVLWIAIGAFVFKPFIPDLPVSLVGCNASVEFSHEALINSSVIKHHPTEDNISIVYKISYLWYSALGVLLVLLIGIPVSLISKCLTQEAIKHKIFPTKRKLIISSNRTDDRKGESNKVFTLEEYTKDVMNE